MKESVDLTLIIGPGHHQQKLVDALKVSGRSFEVFNYYPYLSRTTFNSKGVEIDSKKNLFLTKVIQIIWAVCIRIKSLKDRNFHNYIHYRIYDRWVSINYSPSSKLLLGWSQVSLLTITSFKSKNKPVILEYPMIHINEWKRILDSEYKTYAPGKYRYYEVDPKLNIQMKKECELADKIMILSDFAERTFIENGVSEEKLVKVNLYADDKYSTIHKTSKVGKTTRLLFVGRIDILKGIPRLLEVLDRMILIHPEIKLTMVGELKEEVRHLFAKNRSYLELAGVRSKQELQNYYENSDILILPSVQESFGLVVLEALAHGMRVIASKNSGAPDIAKHCSNIKTFDPFNGIELENILRSELEGNNKKNVSCDLTSYSKAIYTAQIQTILNKYLK